jgi:23S rRNA (pseudouridine1915-N3)-methyltransferase
MTLDIYQIAKNDKDQYEPIVQNFLKMSKKFAKIEVHNMFNKHISKAQTISKLEAQKSYTEVFEPKMQNSFNIALDVLGTKQDSFEFSNMITNHSHINFFIGGAYGFSKEFIKKCDKIISISDMTMAHKIVNIVLLEQIFRGLCIANNHPYHK